MVTRTSLPNDVARCVGQQVECKLRLPCKHCARRAIPHVPPATIPLFTKPPIDADREDCAWFIDMEIDND